MSKDNSCQNEPTFEDNVFETNVSGKNPLDRTESYRIRRDSNSSELKKHFPGDISALRVGARIFSIRKSLGITQEDMAAKLNISPSGFRRLENGSVFPNGVVLIGLHEVYGVDLVWLLYGTHSTHTDILNALSSQSERVKFDIFTRLFLYFSTNESLCFLPSFDKCEGAEHFAKRGGSFFVPIDTSEDNIDGEKEYIDGSVFDIDLESYINTYMSESLKATASIFELLNSKK